ncbi:hypothetical protein [Lacisediminimonas sp.]|uniref:hypothetical protein n=1 Tax=Lacisediminimonas sp. TaxID=3060582 RepID=UPI002724514B|nr:hypothetical protein [Lacisediminimonas sp.]MDO8298091.1 hypothetical protein [Lacisediminimonas sp.]
MSNRLTDADHETEHGNRTLFRAQSFRVVSPGIEIGPGENNRVVYEIGAAAADDAAAWVVFHPVFASSISRKPGVLVSLKSNQDVLAFYVNPTAVAKDEQTRQLNKTRTIGYSPAATSTELPSRFKHALDV